MVAMVVGLAALCAASPVAAQSKEDSQWAPTAGGTLGKLDSGPLSTFMEKIGLELDMTGRTFDVGAARGRPGHSMIRITFTQIRIKDGSSANDGFYRFVTDNVAIRGLKVERQFRFGPTKWPVAPMLTVHGGVGKVSGSVAKFQPAPGTRRYDGPPISSESVVEIFEGHSWLPIFGLGVGATASPSRHLTVTVAAYGLDTLGAYKGLVQVVYWPR
ncbi:MAG: hypothetical protein A3J07_02160 [Candidatus Doudnabacteria bacterium RIFCSPLOWO2_02_FULL_49_13]|uniref:Uncharacterized protein n=1 Tax=Candidatus Doudnabacteria bacterium RIFCSPHIGHO2_12_FULL_48_16 TaxID=1817838 RepID=A0A1F5PLI8_9BACT|nr:MAG: hypothetical protein A3B77_00550 [Candidatus Doudnabacteria bacterium RIFCSPHIGHO2_02_FULL_49_24]OGE89662.1 MAG: hypothetical protein A2760_00655 [Candidatus Doudnabacteria bacterium RIFCSPHIGHO2_01_FULL_50_67]OGE90737.1 MAG: hypothetical protein A3E29_01260 [Candidatus Doudnabacteria bacterium RIFCSPHIGHO2_12_FULL_48_16]OGE96849.1 MAG: hypothetical protein A2990_03370 [Candidatus Doudnabacteria bacterium RIFCSPLOWO2_01_FULL_49_40]OGF02600.1 MAG: hypothetical protein A3J07_02160 [Candid